MAELYAEFINVSGSFFNSLSQEKESNRVEQSKNAAGTEPVHHKQSKDDEASILTDPVSEKGSTRSMPIKPLTSISHRLRTLKKRKPHREGVLGTIPNQGLESTSASSHVLRTYSANGTQSRATEQPSDAATLLHNHDHSRTKLTEAREAMNLSNCTAAVRSRSTTERISVQLDEDESQTTEEPTSLNQPKCYAKPFTRPKGDSANFKTGDVSRSPDFLAAFEALVNNVLPLLTQPQDPPPSLDSLISKSTKLCTTVYYQKSDGPSSPWVALFFQRPDNWIQLALLPFDHEQDAILIEPPIVEADESSPLFAYCGQDNTHILRLFYVRTTGAKRMLREHNLTLDSDDQVAYREGSINTLEVYLDGQSAIHGHYSNSQDFCLVVQTPSLSLQMIQLVRGQWKLFTSERLELGQIKIFDIRVDTHSTWLGAESPIVVVETINGGNLVHYRWFAWDKKRTPQIFLVKEPHFGKWWNPPWNSGIENLSWYSVVILRNARTRWFRGFAYCSLNELRLKEPGQTDHDRNRYIFGDYEGRDKLVCKILRGSACHYDHYSDTFICFTEDGDFIRLLLPHADLATHQYLSLKRKVFAEIPRKENKDMVRWTPLERPKRR